MADAVEQWGLTWESRLWLLWPSLFLLGLWVSLWDLQRTRKVLPAWRFSFRDALERLAKRSAPSAGTSSVLQLLSSVTHYQAWQLGSLAARLEAGSLSEPEALQAACLLLQPHGTMGHDTPLKLSRQELLEMGDLLYSRYTPGATLSLLSGMMTFANVIWVCGAIGVAVAFFPAIYPLLQHLLPLLLTLHHCLLPFYGLVLYGAWLYIICLAARHSFEAAPFVALTGSLLALATYITLLMRQAPSDDCTTSDCWDQRARWFQMWTNTTWVFGLLMFAPLTLVHRSALLGFFASAMLFGLLGFLVIPFGLGWAVGWEDEHSMQQTSIASGILTVLLLSLRVVRIRITDKLPAHGLGYGTAPAVTLPPLARFERVARPFYPGLSCFGCITLLLSGLIYSSIWYSGSYQYSFPYLQRNAAWLAVMVAVTGSGALLGDACFRNTGATFLALWLSEKLVEADFLNGWLVVLLCSAALLAAGHFLKTHPDWLLAMLMVREQDLPGSCGSGVRGGAPAAAAAAAATAAEMPAGSACNAAQPELQPLLQPSGENVPV